jgi:hypothetical protein
MLVGIFSAVFFSIWIVKNIKKTRSYITLRADEKLK